MVTYKGSLGMGIQVIGVDKVLKNMGNLTNWANVTLPKLTFEQADRGAQIAAQIAPYQTGALVRAIKVKPGKNDTWSIVSMTPKGQGARIVPYHLFIQMGRYGRRGSNPGVMTGDHNYMKSTARLLEEMYPQKVLNSLRQTINK